MVFQKDDDYNISEFGNWNVAADYSRLKIMKPLYLCETYENLAKFGYDSILDQLVNFSVPTDIIRLIGFDRLVNELLRIIQNSKFALRQGNTLKEIEKFEEKLEKILEAIPALSKTSVNAIKKSRTIKIDEEKYKKVLKIVLKIKSDINDPLNKNDLIFTHTEEFDMEKAKADFFKRMTTRG